MLTEVEVQRLADRFLTPARRRRFAEIAGRRLHLRLLCEQPSDDRNVAACARSCEVFGGNGIHGTRNDNLDPLLAWRAARGSSRWLDVQWHPTTADAVAHLRGAGYELVGTSVAGDGVAMADWQPQGPVAIVMGPEFSGISEELRDSCDQLVHVPMYGFTESLNLAVAASILLQHASNGLRTRGCGALSPEEQGQLIQSWYLQDLTKRFGDTLEDVAAQFFSSTTGC